MSEYTMSLGGAAEPEDAREVFENLVRGARAISEVGPVGTLWIRDGVSVSADDVPELDDEEGEAHASVTEQAITTEEGA